MSNRNIYFLLADGGVNYLNMPDYRVKTNVDRVLFYWTPELPAMLVKQAHVVAKAIQTPEFEDILKNHLLGKVNQQHYSYQDVINYRQKNNIAVLNKEDILEKYISVKKIHHVSTMNTSYRALYQRAIVPYIYPSTCNNSIWQAQKIDITEGFFTRDQDWVHLLHGNSRISDIVLSGTKALYNSISPAYLNTKGTGFRSMLKYYKVGQIPAEKIGLHGRI